MNRLLQFLDRNAGRLIVILLCVATIEAALFMLDIRLPGSRPRGPEVGTVVRHVVIPVGTKVVPVLTSTCPHCKHSVPSWNAIAVAGGNVVGVFLSDPSERDNYIEQNDIVFPIVSPTDRDKFVADLGISAVPATLIVDDENRIVRVYEGRLDDPGVVLDRLNLERRVTRPHR